MFDTIATADLCRNCRRPRTSKRFCRGLCHPCYEDITIRKKYPSQSPYGNRMGDSNIEYDFEGPAKMPRTATDARPGSQEKIRVLRQRFKRKQSLWHPDDAVDMSAGKERQVA